MKSWIIVTGAGSGIGAAIVKELSKLNLFHFLAIGRRSTNLEKTKSESSNNEKIFTLSADIGNHTDLEKIKSFIPNTDLVKYLIQNAAVGVPDRLVDMKRQDFEYALAVNVTAPLFLTQMFLPQMKKCKGRILHLGTGVAFHPQIGTATYGISKMAFHRLFTQLQVELKDTEVNVASLLPGVVDTEGLWEHYELAKQQQLPHVSYFDQVKKENKISSAEFSAKFIKYVLVDSADADFSKEWNIHDSSHWSFWKDN